MTKVDIFSGFLGAGKTTLIKKLIEEAYQGEQLVLIENEFGEIGIDGGFLKDSGVQINEMNSGCICCTLVGDFGRALEQVIRDFAPDRILIEPSGVGKLSDVIIAVQDLHNDDIQLNGFTTVVDGNLCSMYMENFGEFYENQVEHASSIILSRTQEMEEAEIKTCVDILRQHNEEATIVTTPWEEITGGQILEIMEQKKTLSAELEKLRQEAYEEEAAHAHHDHDHGHDHHDHECHCHDHEHDHHDHECHCHDHEHDHHDHDHECHCHDHEHDHHDHGHECHCHDHHHHHADEVFSDVGVETAHKYTTEQIQSVLEKLEDAGLCGQVLRAKGIVAGEDGNWIHFDYVPGKPEVRHGSADVTGRICVIGVDLETDHIKELFAVK